MESPSRTFFHIHWTYSLAVKGQRKLIEYLNSDSSRNNLSTPTNQLINKLSSILIGPAYSLAKDTNFLRIRVAGTIFRREFWA
ncbi:unnamed protein product [Rhizophagus irregularis]|nr:unnamed protein product [Rhizophagus irregularis]